MILGAEASSPPTSPARQQHWGQNLNWDLDVLLWGDPAEQGGARAAWGFGQGCWEALCLPEPLGFPGVAGMAAATCQHHTRRSGGEKGPGNPHPYTEAIQMSKSQE